MEIKKFGTQNQAQNQKPSKVEGISNPVKLEEGIVSILNERIGDEYTAHYFYRNASNWCKDKNYKKAASFFEAEANSELEHAKGLQDYLIQWNIYPTIPGTPTSADFSGLVDIINKAYEMEYGLFQKYSGDQKTMFEMHPSTFNFIQKYVDIQNDSIGEYSDLLNAINLVDSNNKFEVLYFEQTYFQ